MKNNRLRRKIFSMFMLLCAPVLVAADQAPATGTSASTSAEQTLIQPNKKSFAQEVEELRQQNPLAYRRFQRMYGVNPDGTVKIPTNPESPAAPADVGSESSKGK